jgi:1-acyl-sn-glycerol-3-phosphate acyltransferase
MDQSPDHAAPDVDHALDASHAQSNSLRALLRLLAVFMFSAWALAGWILVRTTCRGEKRFIDESAAWTRYWARGMARCMGLSVSSNGATPPQGALLTPNHIGYVDVFALASILPCHFVAKAEVTSWPFVGTLFTASGHIGVDRSAKRGLKDITTRVANRLALGDMMCVFLEGTSTGGDRIIPFHSSLAQPAIDAMAPVVPVAIRWRCTRDDMRVSEDVAYWKDHVFAHHVWRLLGLSGVTAEVTFGDPVSSEGHTRKSLAQETRSLVVAMTGLPAKPAKEI